MNIVTILRLKNFPVGLKYYGTNDMSTNIIVGYLLSSQNEILTHYVEHSITNIDEYIDFIFLSNLINFSEVIPFVVKDKRDEFSTLIEGIKERFGKYKVCQVVKYVVNNYQEIYRYIDVPHENHISHDVKAFTTAYIGKHYKSFSNETLVFVIKNRHVEIVDKFEIWKKYFDESPSNLLALFCVNNLKELFVFRKSNVYHIIEDLHKSKKYTKICATLIGIIYDLNQDETKSYSSGGDIVNHFYEMSELLIFLRKVKSPLANTIEKLYQRLADDFNRYLVENGSSVSIRIDLTHFKKMFENARLSEDIRGILITHSLDNNGKYESYIVHSAQNVEYACSDYLGRKAPNENEYFDSAKIRSLKICLNELKHRLSWVLNTSSNAQIYKSSVFRSVSFICASIATSCEDERLNDDLHILFQNLEELFDHSWKLDVKTDFKFKKLVFAHVTLICGLIEKVLRIVYSNLHKSKSYISSSSLTLGSLLKVNEQIENPIVSILGPDLVKCIRYFLITTEDDNVGDNLRNDFAHMNGSYSRKLNMDTVLHTQILFSSVINCLSVYFNQNKSRNP